MSRPPRWSTKRAWQVAAFGLVVLASGYLLLAPVYQPQTECSGGGSYSPSGELVSSWDTCDPPGAILTSGNLSLVAWVSAPVLLAALPLAAHGRAWTVLSTVSAVSLVVFVLFLGGFAIGPSFVPGTVCAVVGALLRQRRAGSPSAPTPTVVPHA
ncbi:hypothetical protein [Xylanimonas protaetiae]|uniref:Uncharacterized protein n=1 Tax=Xylanimonas protaetiae TaxID=2509457 RepID=A0A4P6F239_9MICO|nr:hypothetical protein [Xylanimonas protaetiae]QAY69246.1 hypothetical protein ET471_03660 [Xylanimonas protaetiae]